MPASSWRRRSMGTNTHRHTHTGSGACAGSWREAGRGTRWEARSGRTLEMADQGACRRERGCGSGGDEGRCWSCVGGEQLALVFSADVGGTGLRVTRGKRGTVERPHHGPEVRRRSGESAGLAPHLPISGARTTAQGEPPATPEREGHPSAVNSCVTSQPQTKPAAGGNRHIRSF